MDRLGGGREGGRMTSDDQDGALAEQFRQPLGELTLDELVALGDALDLRVRRGTATLEDFGALARARRELARRVEVTERARTRGAIEPG